jgi:tagatose 6-phosphate kinase
VTDAEWQAFVDRYTELSAGAEVVVLSGSLPPGVPDDGYARLLRIAAGACTILDSSGPALMNGLAGRPDLVKPNRDELRAATGHIDPAAGAAALRQRGAGAVIASLGRRGLIAVTGQGGWRAAVPGSMAGNPTGAGDACVAALSVALRDGVDWPGALADAVALSGAAVATPVAGEIDLDVYRRLRPIVAVEALPC